MKNMKKQLFTAVAMLLVATVALGTATYAWFVNNATGNVETMNFTADTSTSMQIGLGTASAGGISWKTDSTYKVPHDFVPPSDVAATYGWKGLINTADIKSLYSITGSFAPLMPASTVTNINTNGFYQVETWKDDSQKATTFAAISDFNPDGDKNSAVLAIPLYLKSSADMPVYLKEDTVNDLITATSPAIKGAVRVALVTDKNVSGGAVTTHIFQDSASHADNPYNTTNNTTNEDGTKGITNASGVLGDQAAKDWKKYQSATDGNFATPTAGKESLFTLAKDTPTQVMVYVWLEGCDWDCITEVSNLPFNVNLSFVGKKPATT